MSVRTWATALALCAGLGTAIAEAAPPKAGRIKVFVVQAGSGEVVSNGYIPDLATTDTVFFLFLGSGNARFTLTDADAPGDTVKAEGTVASVAPFMFTATATSPNQIVEVVPIALIGVLRVNISYTNAVNPFPLQYFYKLEF